MVNWLHIIWVAPAFAMVGFIGCALFAAQKLAEVEDRLFDAQRKLRGQCEKCDAGFRAEAAEADKRALEEQVKTYRASNSQLRGMVLRQTAGVKK